MRIEHVKNIGDIDIYSNEDFVMVMVDHETVLSMPRAGHGLDQLVETLAKLVK